MAPSIEMLSATAFRLLTPAEIVSVQPELNGDWDGFGSLDFKCLCGERLCFGGQADDSYDYKSKIVEDDGALTGIECPSCRRIYTLALRVMEP